MRFAIASEGKTDFIVLKNLLVGFFADKNLPVTRLRPRDDRPFGWGNLFRYLSSEEFAEDCSDDNIDYVVIQLDSNECADWKEGVRHIGADPEQVTAFVGQITTMLQSKIYAILPELLHDKLIFAICVHDVECWLLPFNTDGKAIAGKMVGCYNALEQIARKKGFSLNQKNYQEGKHYDVLSKSMKDGKVLMAQSAGNPSLGLFVQSLQLKFNGALRVPMA
jgi:hypothetical protein